VQLLFSYAKVGHAIWPTFLELGEAVEPPPLPHNKWTLTQGAFDLLLAQLDADRQVAGSKYEALRRKLVQFFRWRGCSFAEDLADDTINRIAKNLEAGETIRHFAAYCVGIARHVFLESLRTRRQEEAVQAGIYLPPPSPNEDPRQECLERCLQGLSPDDLQLVMQYYQNGEGARIAARRNLSARLSIPLNALRIRAHRIRVRLRGCVEDCMMRQNKS
jgi:DNA-directed RNA polymerase specialized sigma24 family protein